MDNIQWYPGHMTKTKRMLAAQMGIIDVVIELLDARVPLSSRNPDIDTLAKDKKRVLVLNKADLADEKVTALWEEYFKKQGFFALSVNATENDKAKSGKAKLISVLKKIMSEKVERQKQRGRINSPIRAMIVGIPNVGKSTFINQLAGRASAIAADKPGVTRGRQWIKVGGEFDLMDTPGVLWPKFDDPLVGLRLACTGAVSDNVFDKITLVTHLLEIFISIDPAILEKRYKISVAESDNLLEAIGNARGFKMKGGVIDSERTAITVLDEFRGGKLGRISLETVTK
ncbi:MAG: ribosome biogenesis GTPase YlqF [Clostridiales bacterium]|jgi:ribosome biogenesis GTPase A|nr:ribosome biogenesis GTPase YlqF [Clostridiales bacterium]